MKGFFFAFCGAGWRKVIRQVWHGLHLIRPVTLCRTAPQNVRDFHAPPDYNTLNRSLSSIDLSLSIMSFFLCEVF